MDLIELLVKDYVEAALSLWEGGDYTSARTSHAEYVRAQAETLARMIQARGYPIDSGVLVTDFRVAVYETCAGRSTAAEALRFHVMAIVDASLRGR